MKILYAVSLFSGLLESVKTRKWNPTGAPTIYKMIERLDSEDVEFVFCATEKIDGFRWIKKIYLNGLMHPVWIVPYFKNRILREFVRTYFLCKLHRKEGFDKAYFNNGLLFPAAWFTRRKHCKVIFRIMGVYPSMWKTLERKSIIQRLESAAYASHFWYVICTEDGSGGPEWMQKMLSVKYIPVRTLLNGVDETGHEIVQTKKPMILWVGQLKKDKGCLEFSKAISILRDKYPGRFLTVVIGDGPELEYMACEMFSLDTKFISKIPHDEIHKWYNSCDLYVSLNKLGHLSNTNLEAIASGCPIVMLEPEYKTLYDNLLDGCLFVSRNNTVDGLVGVFEEMLRHHGFGLREPVKIWSWENRINEELKIIGDI